MDSTSGNWRSLAAAYAEGVICPPREAAVIVAALLADLGRLHRAGKVHGAIDPAHVQVAQGGRARLAEPGRDSAAPAYQAPELHAGQPASPRSDLFAAGLVFYRLLTGMNPFDGSPNLVRQRVTNMMPPRPSEIAAGVSRAFDTVVDKALAKRPDERYASAEAFTEALMQALVPGSASEAGGDDTTLATTVVRRPGSTDATIMRGGSPNPDATVMRAPNRDPEATVMMRAAPPDATVLRSPIATAPGGPSSLDTARGTPPVAPAPAPSPAAGGGKGVIIGVVLAVLLAGAGAVVFLFK